jgi:hypothetical protein
MKLIPFIGSSRKYYGMRFGLFVSVVVLLLSLPSVTRTFAAMEYRLEDDLIKLANDHYEFAFRAADGGIAYILDKASNQNISEGSRDGNLWQAVLEKSDAVSSSGYGDQFAHAWDEASRTLTLSYSGALEVTVTATVSDSPTLSLQATLTNTTGATISGFRFPNGLRVVEADIEDALLPMMPGALLSSVFFEEGRTFVNQYPGVMFADYLAIRSERGNIALYSQRNEQVQSTLIGYEHLQDDPATTALTHSYQTWVEDGKTWAVPAVIVQVSQDYPDSIAGYRTVNKIDEYASLTEKLGDDAQIYFAAPMYKLDLAVLRLKFADLQAEVIDKLEFPGMVHFVAFQLAGHDKNYPDFIPPDPKWGTTEDFASLVSAIHEVGSLAVPYTNFSWWDNDGPTMSALPEDLPLYDVINVKDSFGLPGFESYGPNSGYVMNLHNAFVQDKISEQHSLLTQTIGVDGIFEDQWGARNAPNDFNAAGLDVNDPSTSYFEGVLNHYRSHHDSNLMTEVGVDVLADQGIAFMGTNYLWDMLGYRSATAGVTSYYPMAGMLLRDKVLLYQHNLAAETWTQNKELLRWNLTQGYGLSTAFYDANVSRLNMDNPWLHLIGLFHKYALANYADQLVVSFDDLGDNVTQTTFETYTVHSNWDAENAYSVGDHTLPPGGVITQANDGSVTAGVFSAYNDHELSDGDHYLVEVRSPDAVKIFQPVGDDTDISILKDAVWDTVTVTAYQYDGTAIASVDANVEGDDIAFTYSNMLDGRAVSYYEIKAAE